MTHRSASWLSALVPLLPMASGAAAQSLADLATRAEATDFAETSSYEEVMDMSSRLAELSDQIHLTTFGETTEGRSLPLLVVGAPDPTPEAVRGTGKTRIYLQGDIHAGEVCGKEALLMLVRDYARGMYPSWTDDLVLLVAPIYNADGNERMALTNRPRQHGPIGGMGQRPNAQGLDLNRDHMKLDSPEARALVRLFNDYDPHVAVDLHTTNGTRHAYHLTYAPPLHPNTPDAIDAFLRDEWLPTVTDRIQDEHGWSYYYYGNHDPRRPGWYTFDHRPRFNNNYVGLRNRMAILSEAYAYATFEDRVMATVWFVEEVLDFALERAQDIRRITERADMGSVAGETLATRADFRRSDQRVDILLGEVDEERHPETGEVMLRRRDVSIPTPMYEYGTFAATTTEIAPDAYYLLPEAADAVELLRLHGVAAVPVLRQTSVVAQRFRIDSTRVAERPFQGHAERTVDGEWVDADDGFVGLPAGTVVVPLNQRLGRLAFSLLEPESDDGLVAWGLLDDFVARGEFPILRASARSP